MQTLYSGLSAINIAPNPNGLPGGAALSSLVGGLEYFGVILALAGLVISAIVWGVSGHSANPSGQARGRTGVLVSLAAALVIGGGSLLVNWATGIGAAI